MSELDGLPIPADLKAQHDELLTRTDKTLEQLNAVIINTLPDADGNIPVTPELQAASDAYRAASTALSPVLDQVEAALGANGDKDITQVRQTWDQSRTDLTVDTPARD